MKNNFFITIFLFASVVCTAQGTKKKLTFDDILNWNRITETKISNNGKYVVYKAEPWKGDPVIKISNKKGEELGSFTGATNLEITNDSKYAIFIIQPKEEEIRQLKLKNTKKEDMPMDELGIYNLEKKSFKSIARLISHKVPEKWDGWALYQAKSVQPKDTTDSNKKTREKTKEESDENGYTLFIENLESGEKIQFPFVTEYILAENSEIIGFVSTGDEKGFEAGIYYYNLKNNKKIEILTGKGSYEQLSLNKDGSQLAFLADTANNKRKNYKLYLWKGSSQLKELVNNNNENIIEGWEISKNGKIFFSETSGRIYFGIAPIRPERDTTKLEEEIPQLDIWHWNEPVLHTEQINTKSEDLKKTYLAVYHTDKNKMVQLETRAYTGIDIDSKGEMNKIPAWSNLPYAVQTMWEGGPVHNDFYLIDVNTGKSNLIKKDCRATPRISPTGKYIYWYDATDTSWNTYSIALNKEYKITSPALIQCADEINDVPNLPDDYGLAGWLKDDEAILIYDRYDIWKVGPENKTIPVNITANGRQKQLNYRYIDFERTVNGEEKGIDQSKPIYLKGHNEITREDGYYKLSIRDKDVPTKLLGGKFMLNDPIKANDADVFIFTKETFQQFPDLLLSTSEFKKHTPISNANPQQKQFRWGSIELYTWTSLDGRKLSGLLVKPENFDPARKYPMIVNFYEKSSQGLYAHRIPEAHRSTVDYHYYTSNDYIIFNPDVYYDEGYPGESAFNCVMPGVTALIKEGFVDENHIAAQGHSWGGYQVAYLATRTNLFAAIESGAPVVNMFSAYGGIRLWSGRNRSFQYEHTQSRIGKSIWESPLRYLENSPLFTADKITTPLLIMHNENDGAVPFSQGVEFFIALRRMGKKAWLLNYNEADHWPTKVRDKYDFQVRLSQFFGYYLKGEPMPRWMKEGIPAVNKGFDMGYDNE